MPRPRKPKPAQHKAPPTDWGKVADWYDDLVGEEGSEYQRQVVFPNVLRMLSLQPGQRILDIACGQGVFCRLLLERGAQPTGVDAARSLIHIARQRTAGAIDYHVGDARELTFLPHARFDAAVCLLAIQNIHPFQPVFDGAARALAPDGRLIVVMMHPCFRSPKHTAWGWDEQNTTQYRRVDRYLLPRKEPIVTHPGKDPGKYTWTFHRPIGDYVKALRRAGLLLDALEEWPSHKTSQPGARADAENQARLEIPMFLALRALKAQT